MSGRTIAFIIVFVTMLFASSFEARAHSLAFSLTPEMAVKKSSIATTKAQAGFTVGIDYTYVFPNDYFLELRGGFRSFLQSSGGSDWILYKGFTAWGWALGGGYRFPEVKLFGEIRAVPFVTLRGYGNFAKYRNTEIHYFYPGFEVEPSMEAFSFSNGRMCWQIGIPLTWNFQRDLDLFLTAGISIRMRFSFDG